MKLERIRNPYCFCDFSLGAKIKTESGRYLGTTSDKKEAEKIITKYFEDEWFPEPVHVFFGWDWEYEGTWGYTFTLAERAGKPA